MRRGLAIGPTLLLLLLGCRKAAPGDAAPPEEGAAPAVASAPVAPPVVASRPEHVPPGVGCMTTGCHAPLKTTAFVHGPIVSGSCDACHGDQQPGHKFPLKRSGDATCTFCHVVLTGKPVVHAALKQDAARPGRPSCLNCHQPHGSATRFLLAADTIEANCRRCHPATETGKSRHGPFAAGACTLCHAPHEADNKSLTIRTGAEHCFRCHTDMRTRVEQSRVVHPPVRDACTNCHSPHAAEFPKLLRASGAEQCAACHADVVEKARTAVARHGAVFTAAQCLNCHDVHGSAQPALLKQAMPDVCLTCHDQPQKAYDGRTIPEMRTRLVSSAFLHGPVRAGECQACHAVHGSSNSRLLKKYFPETFYKDFDLANYSLCFSCHDQALVTEARTDRLTGFRNGDVNLHALHVGRVEKGRTCKACHEIHGSDQPKHLAGSVPFEGGGWALPINFRKTATGGGCAPGCHQPYEYDRVRAVQWKPEGKTAGAPATRPAKETP
ncbi:MAG: cytochrome c3 family protein [Phycisphaerae bacterium]